MLRHLKDTIIRQHIAAATTFSTAPVAISATITSMLKIAPPARPGEVAAISDSSGRFNIIKSRFWDFRRRMDSHFPNTRRTSPTRSLCESMLSPTAALLRLRPMAFSPNAFLNFASIRVWPISDDSGSIAISAMPISAERSEK